jgi:8-oxo-dGTP pyrophosphatase MutT (NUDIX family)
VTDGGPAHPAPAATVVLVRPGPDGPEVLLTRRPATMAFAAGAWVFPGGRVDARDQRREPPSATGLTGPQAAARLAGTLSPADALAHHAAAVRETEEETGIRIAEADLVPLSRWVTPESLPRRFDVRFFAVPVPAGTVVVGHSAEVAAAAWLTPRAALAGARSGAMSMLLPTLVTLQQLDGLVDVGELSMAFAPGAALDPPAVVDEGGGLARVAQRWAAGIPGRSAIGWLVGDRELVLVDPADPTGETTSIVDQWVRERGSRLVGVALTASRPECQAGVELYATGRGLPVTAGSGIAVLAPYAVVELRPGDIVPFGDVAMTAAVARPGGPSGVGVDELAYRLPDGRRLPAPGLDDRAGFVDRAER